MEIEGGKEVSNETITTFYKTDKNDFFSSRDEPQNFMNLGANINCVKCIRYSKNGTIIRAKSNKRLEKN